MIILNEFIWKEDHYAFHVTNVDAMKSICRDGLIPLCGERSRSVNDDIIGIFFFDHLVSASFWMDVLYENKDITELELLRFNLKDRMWIKHNDNEFYLPNGVFPNDVEYLRIYDPQKQIYLPLNYIDDIDYIDDDYVLKWNSLDEYKPLIKNIKGIFR